MMLLRRGERSGIQERSGSCHRCGWHDRLTKVARGTAVPGDPPRQLRWVCDDCLAILHRASGDGHVLTDLPDVAEPLHTHNGRRPAA